MNNSPRLTPILVAVSILLSAAAPRAALAQVAVRAAPGAVVTPVTVAPGVSALPGIPIFTEAGTAATATGRDGATTAEIAERDALRVAAPARG